MADNQQAPIDPTGGMGMQPGAMEDNSLDEQVSAVAETGGKKTALIVAGALVVLYMGYGMLFSEKPKTQAEIDAEKEAAQGVVSKQGITLPGEQSIGEAPPEPTAVPLPPLPPMPEPPPMPTASMQPMMPQPGAAGSPMFPMQPGVIPGNRPQLPGAAGAAGAPGAGNFSEAEKARVRANSILQGGSGRFKAPEEQGQGVSSSSGGGASSGGDKEPEQKSSVNEVGDPNLMIAQGKIISAVLETAINTDLPGALRAVVSRDVYAEQGKNVVIPRGSRLIGSYNTEIKRGQARIYIVWQRLIMPNGFDLQIGSPSTDLLGRSGIEGHVDNKYFELFSNSLLLSSLSVGFAVAVDSLTDSQSISQGETGSGDATTSGSVIDIATLDAVNDFSDQVQGVVQELVQVTPTITVNQGTEMKIFVNRDMFFPEELAFLLEPPVVEPVETEEEISKKKRSQKAKAKEAEDKKIQAGN